MNRHPFQDGVVLLQLQAVRGVFLVLRCNITGSARHTACLVLGAFQNHLHASLFILLSHGYVVYFSVRGCKSITFLVINKAVCKNIPLFNPAMGMFGIITSSDSNYLYVSYDTVLQVSKFLG